MLKYNYLVSSSHSSKVGHVGNGTHRESLMNQSIVDEHVGHTKHSYSKTLHEVGGVIVESFGGYYRQIANHS